MATQIVMDHTGDTRHYFNASLIAMEKNKDRWQCPRIAFSLMHS
jgi:hypothetical protein